MPTEPNFVGDILTRLDKLEEWQAALNIERAREDENRKHTDAQFLELKNQLAEIKSSINKAMNTGLVVFLAPIGAAVVAFIIHGGLFK